MFEKATREKYRFDSPVGPLTVEDLWDLPLTGGLLPPGRSRANLDDIAIGLRRQMLAAETESFVRKTKKNDAVVQTKFAIVKHVIDVKLAEQEAAEKAAANRAKKQKILEIIERKQSAQLEATPLEDLVKMVNELT
jgi:hypothetical protein